MIIISPRNTETQLRRHLAFSKTSCAFPKVEHIVYFEMINLIWKYFPTPLYKEVTFFQIFLNLPQIF